MSGQASESAPYTSNDRTGTSRWRRPRPVARVGHRAQRDQQIPVLSKLRTGTGQPGAGGAVRMAIGEDADAGTTWLP